LVYGVHFFIVAVLERQNELKYGKQNIHVLMKNIEASQNIKNLQVEIAKWALDIGINKVAFRDKKPYLQMGKNSIFFW